MGDDDGEREATVDLSGDPSSSSSVVRTVVRDTARARTMWTIDDDGSRRAIDRSDRIVIGSRRARGTIDRSIDASIGSMRAFVVTVTVIVGSIASSVAHRHPPVIRARGVGDMIWRIAREEDGRGRARARVEESERDARGGRRVWVMDRR